MTDIVEGSNRLPELAAKIRAEHEACSLALKRGLQHAVAAGEMLIEAKALAGHGNWLPWLREHCGISERTARRYMEIAPYADARIKSARLADLVTDAVEDAVKPLSLDGPFTEDDADTDGDWLCTKLLHQVEAPPLVSMLLRDEDRHDLHLLRLCDFDELEQAAVVLAPVASKSDKQALKINADTITALQRVANMIEMMATWLLGGVLSEIERRDVPGYSDEQYRREFDETHAAWMAALEEWLAENIAMSNRATRPPPTTTEDMK